MDHTVLSELWLRSRIEPFYSRFRNKVVLEVMTTPSDRWKIDCKAKVLGFTYGWLTCEVLNVGPSNMSGIRDSSYMLGHTAKA